MGVSDRRHHKVMMGRAKVNRRTHETPYDIAKSSYAFAKHGVWDNDERWANHAKGPEGRFLSGTQSRGD